MKPFFYLVIISLFSFIPLAAHADYVESTMITTTTTTTTDKPVVKKDCDCPKKHKKYKKRHHKNSYYIEEFKVNDVCDCYHCYRGECECYYRAYYPQYTNQFDYAPYYEVDYLQREYNAEVQCMGPR